MDINDNTNSINNSPPANMWLWDHECQWALDIKEAVEADPELENLCDYDYAQYALITKGDCDHALERIQGLQHFREEYGIPLNATRMDNHVQEGIQILLAFLEQQKGLVLDVEYEETYGHYVEVMDWAAFNPAAAKATPLDWKVFLCGLYYLTQLKQSNLGAIRQGIVRICETQGMGWNNFDVDVMRNVNSHLMEFYPSHNKVVSWYHSSSIGNMLHALFKSMTGDRAKVIRMGCEFTMFDGRIDVLFKTPTEEAAQARLLGKFRTYLTERYRNQRDFVLRRPPGPYDDLGSLTSSEEEELDQDLDEEERDEEQEAIP